MESQLAVDPDPEPPSYRIHQEKRGKFSIWVITQNNKLITVLPQKDLAHRWISTRRHLRHSTCGTGLRSCRGRGTDL